MGSFFLAFSLSTHTFTTQGSVGCSQGCDKGQAGDTPVHGACFLTLSDVSCTKHSVSVGSVPLGAALAIAGCHTDDARKFGRGTIHVETSKKQAPNTSCHALHFLLTLLVVSTVVTLIF